MVFPLHLSILKDKVIHYTPIMYQLVFLYVLIFYIVPDVDVLHYTNLKTTFSLIFLRRIININNVELTA